MLCRRRKEMGKKNNISKTHSSFVRESQQGNVYLWEDSYWFEPAQARWNNKKAKGGALPVEVLEKTL